MFLLKNSVNNLGDTSLFVSHIRSFSVGDGWARNYLASNIQALKNSGESAQYWCKNLIGAELPEIRSGMAEHAYPYLLFLGYISKIFDLNALNLYMLVLAVAHLAPLIYTLLLIRKLKQKYLQVFALSVGIYSNLITIDLLNAQPHIEQLIYIFLPPYIFLCFKRAQLNMNSLTTYSTLFTFGILCSGVSERASLICGLISFTLVLWLVFNRNFVGKDFFILFLAIFQIFWFFVWNKLFASSFYYAAINFDTIFQNLQFLFSSTLARHTYVYILVNLLTLLIIFQLRIYSLWALIAFLPNLLLTVGGAEKDAFLISQYHAFYFCLSTSLFVIITFYSSMLEIRVTRFFDNLFHSLAVVLFSFFLMIVIPNINENYHHQSIIEFPKKLVHTFIPFLSQDNSDDVLLTKLLMSLPKNSSISIPEEVVMKFVQQGFYNFRYYPTDLQTSNLVITPILKEKNSNSGIGGLPLWFHNSFESAILGECVKNYLLSQNFRFSFSFMHHSKEYLVWQRY